jgi:predicted O-methyltransferase YrrM
MKLRLLQEIFDSNQVTDEDGNPYSLHSSITPEEGEFIQSVISGHRVRRTLEIGCAFGISSLYICSALVEKINPYHVMIDPHEFTTWHGIGISNLRRSGFSFFELIEKPSEIALPELLERGATFDFALIDGWHTFDHALLDFFYVNRMLEPDGMVVFDDIDYPAVKKVIRYISHYRSYEIIGSLRFGRTLRERIGDRLFAGLSNLIRHMPERQVRRIFNDSLVRPDSSLGLNTSMIALRKIAEDERNWDWYEPF